MKNRDLETYFIEASKTPPSGKIRRFKCLCAYDGTDYRGWQSQKGGGSIQDFIEGRLLKIFKRKIRIHAAGRTDAGVHALGQVFHFDAAWSHGLDSLLAALRGGNSDSVRIIKVSQASKDFHARFDAKGKRYVYRYYLGYAPPHLSRYRWSLARRVPDIDKMNSAARILLGEHDFTAFSANRHLEDGKRENTVKRVDELRVSKRGKEIRLVAEGSGFLYKMVRMMAGALLDVGLGKLGEGDIISALESGRRGTLFQAAPAKGLFLEKVYYGSRNKNKAKSVEKKQS